MRRDNSVSETFCVVVGAGVLILLAVALVDLCTFRDDGSPVPGVVAGQGFVPGQTSTGVGFASNGDTITTVSRSQDVYTVVVRTADRTEAMEVSRSVWSRLRDGDAVAVQYRVSSIFGFTSRQLVVSKTPANQ